MGKGVLVHVHDHVHMQRACPADDLRHPVDVYRAKASAFGLEQAPRDRKTDRVEAQGCHLRQVGQAQRRVTARPGVRRAEAVFVGGRIERIDGTRARTELEERGGDRTVEQDHAALIVGDVRDATGWVRDVQPRQAIRRFGGRHRRPRQARRQGDDECARIREHSHDPHKEPDQHSRDQDALIQ
jgi:hypothetical protein